jgi:proton glutamate symport protein
MNHSLKHHAVHSSTVLAAIGIGMALGHFFPGYNDLYKKISHLYLALLEMSVLPVMSTAVITSLGSLFQQGTAWYYLRRMVVVFVLGIATTLFIGFSLGSLIAPGKRLSTAAITTISKALPITEEEQTETEGISGTWSLLEHVVPENIFGALAKGEMLPVLFISILLGIALGMQSNESAIYTIGVLKTVYDAFIKIIGWVMFGLPVGMCFLFAAYLSDSGTDILEAMLWSIVAVMTCYLVMMLIYMAIISYVTRHRFGRSLGELKNPLLLGFLTGSSLMAIPVMLETLRERYVVRKDVVDLAIPLSVSVNRQATMIGFIMTAIFLSQLYGKPLSFENIFILVLTSFLATMASAGLPTIVAISMGGMIFIPIGLPAAVGITLMHALEPLINPFATVVNVLASCASAILVAQEDKKVPPVVDAA